ncbi:hypothetical protein ACHZ98_34205 [Streptomyces sp. MAR4 CNY-716]
MCMRVAITGASRPIGSVVVQGLRVEDAYGLACLARRRSEGPDSHAVPALVLSRALGLLPAALKGRGLTTATVHPDDVAEAIAVALPQRVADPFRLTADTPVSAAVIADALSAGPVPVPSAAVRAVMPAARHARLQQFDTGWLDMAFGTARTRPQGWSGT